MNWKFEPGLGSQWRLTNRTGHTAREVTFAAVGSLVIWGRRDWTYRFNEMLDGRGYPITGGLAWGKPVQKPRIRVTWFSDHRPDRQLVTIVDWPK